MTSASSMIVAGIMSGTSADGIDVALVKITPAAPCRPSIGLSGEEQASPRLTLLADRAFPFPKPLRAAILTAMAGQSDAPNTNTADLARLNWRLGLAYAEALQATLRDTKITPALIGCHGQTVYHQGTPAPYAGRRFACTWQLGEPALIAAATGIPVVSNFRPADMAAGGQGAPLVPLLDFVYFRHSLRGRVLQNIGGIGNLTAIPAGAPLERVIAFDTGPGNMIIDALMQQLFAKPYDRNGRIAARGTILDPVLQSALKEKFFRQPPPKSAGREQFGAAYAEKFLAACRRHSKRPEDAVATATALTAESILDAVRRWVRPLLTTQSTSIPTDFIAAGGGTRNASLCSALRDGLAALGCTFTTADALALPSEAKEAAAFALLAYQTWHHRPANVPSATGATCPAILGQITYV
ncbi:MAG TPA: anhydro-N-acetylmuramic acid kinase [Acidobacteriaceae bacterium]|nr:anhydro-N-acetylmuramic acid kinase [Acidobacteriaceae bacterium]